MTTSIARRLSAIGLVLVVITAMRWLLEMCAMGSPEVVWRWMVYNFFAFLFFAVTAVLDCTNPGRKTGPYSNMMMRV